MATLYSIYSPSSQYYLNYGQPHRYGNSLYVRLSRQSNGSTAYGEVIMRKSTDNGVTWSTIGGVQGDEYDVNGAFAPITRQGRGTVFGTVIYIPYFRQTVFGVGYTGEISILRFDMSSDTWLAEWTGGPALINFCWRAEVEFDSTGAGTVVFDDYDYAPPSYNNVKQVNYVSISSVGVWGAKTTLTNFLQPSSQTSYTEPIYDSSDNLHVFYSVENTTSGLQDIRELNSGIVFDNTNYGAAFRNFYCTIPPKLFEVLGVQQVGLPYVDSDFFGSDYVMGVRYAPTPVNSAFWITEPYTAIGENPIHSACSDGTDLTIQTTYFDGTWLIRRGDLVDGVWSALTTILSTGLGFSVSAASTIVVVPDAGIAMDTTGAPVPYWITEAAFGYSEPCPDCPDCPECPDSGDCIPWDGEPPFPTGEIYGREHLSLNLKLVRGDTYKFDATIVLNNAPVDLTGGTVRMTAKWSLANADNAAVFQLSSPSSGIVITSAPLGQIRVTIASSNTTSLPAKKVELPYDIQFVDSGGAVYTVLYGTLVVVPDASITAP